MDLKYLQKLDRIVKCTGSRKPEDILDYLGIQFLDPGYQVDGFIMRRKNTVYCGVNGRFPRRKFEFGVFHEITHGVCEHLDIPGFLSSDGFHTDKGTFSDRKQIASSERDANIGAADLLIGTQEILEMLGYNREDVAAYRASVESFDKAVRDYEYHIEIARYNGSPERRIRRMEAYRRELHRMYGDLQEQALDILNSGICFSVQEMAQKFGVPEYIIAYKLEALKIRNYDVASAELPSFSNVFRNWGGR